MVLRPLVIGALLIGVTSGPAHAQSALKRKELSQVQKELSETRREIEEFRKREEALGQDIHKLESNGAQARKKIEEIQKNIRSAEQKKTELKTRLGALRTASGSWRSALVFELRQKARHDSALDEAYGTAQLWRESFLRQAILEKGAMLSRLQGVSRKTEIAEAETGRKARELMSKNQQVKAEEETRKLEYQEKKTAYAQTQEKAAAAVARVKDLEESAKALTRLISQFGKEAPYRKSGAAPSAIAKYSLPWPVEGGVTSSFGKELNSALNTWVIHQGIRLQTKANALIAAVARGRVIFSGPFRSYGQVVIVDHGEGLYSIYGELGDILTAKGAKISRGETIAKAGPAKSGGGVLYLEIRQGSEALDPLMWLQKK